VPTTTKPAPVVTSAAAPKVSVAPDHWLRGVKRNEIEGGGPLAPVAVVIHFTDGATADSSVSWWRNPKARGANAHIVIDRAGTIQQVRPFNRTCGHAGGEGKSRWRDPVTGSVYDGLNSRTIGIELANAGRDESGPDGWDWAVKQPWFQSVTAKHRNGGPAVPWEVFYPAQYAACESVVRVLVDHYDLHDITGHDCIAPERKSDPGPAFPMERLRQACGFSGLPTVHW